MDNLIGQSVLHYAVLRQLGRGGMGVVYEARDTRLGRSVALKFLPPQLAQDTAALERFQREARAASALNHPNICTVYAIDQHERQHFIVMELLEGRPLSELMRREPFPMDQLLAIGTATSNRPTSSSAPGVRRRYWTSAWQRWNRLASRCPASRHSSRRWCTATSSRAPARRWAP